MWPLMNFTEDNGPTRVVPSSHLSGKRPYEVLDEPKAPHPDLVYFGSINPSCDLFIEYVSELNM